MTERRVTFFAYMPRANATARQRAFLVGEGLQAAGWDVQVVAPLRDAAYRRYVTPSGVLDRVSWVVEMLARTGHAVLRFKRGDIAVVQRELLPIGSPVLERVLRRKARSLILDVDDAIYATARDRSHSTVGRVLLKPGKFAELCRMADLVVCGNDYLAAEASRFAANVTVIPTSLLFDEAPTRLGATSDGFALGWLGNPGNLCSLAVLAAPLQRLQHEGHAITLRVMSARPPSLEETGGIEVEFTPWSLEGEQEFLADIDAGAMPLADDEYSRGKCGFKLLRYIAAGVPAIASTVGVNEQIVVNGETGIGVAEPSEWYSALRRLMEMSADERAGMARRAADLARPVFSIECAVKTWDGLLEGLQR